MIPSEIAQELEECFEEDTPIHAPLLEAAATIRDLESRLHEWRTSDQEVINERYKWIVELIHERDDAKASLKTITHALADAVDFYRPQAKALKIATEALVEVRDGASEAALIAIADKALARIKETK